MYTSSASNAVLNGLPTMRCGRIKEIGFVLSVTLLEWRVTMFEIFKKHVALAPLPVLALSPYSGPPHTFSRKLTLISFNPPLPSSPPFAIDY